MRSNLRANRYKIAESVEKCPHCNEETSVYAFILDGPYEEIVGVEEANQIIETDLEEGVLTKAYPADYEDVVWLQTYNEIMIIAPSMLCTNVAGAIQTMSSGYRYDKEEGVWINHCEKCDKKIEGHLLAMEPGHAFLPVKPEDGEKIKLYNMPEYFEAYSGTEIEGLTFFAYAEEIFP